jgi:hypothetical protein
MPTGILKKTVIFYLLCVLTFAPATKARADYDIPGDSHIMELLTEMRHLTDANDPNFWMIWGTLLAFLAAHSLFHSIGELRAERFEKLRQAEELRLEIVERKELAAEIDKLTKELTELEKKLATASVNIRKLVKDLSSKSSPETDQRLARAIDQVVALTQSKNGKKSAELFKSVDRFLKSEQGTKFLATSAGKKWSADFAHQAEIYRKNQSKIFSAFHQGQHAYENFAEKQLGDVEMAHQGQHGAQMNIVNEQGLIMARIDPQNASHVLRRQARMCDETIGRLAHKEKAIREEAKIRNYYASSPNRAFLKPPLLLATGSAAGTAGIYAYLKNQTGSDPLQHEMDRHVSFGVRMNSRMDLTSQISSPEGVKELEPFFNAFKHALKDNQTKLADSVSESLRKLNMGDQTTMKLGAAIENDVDVQAAIQMAILKASRADGLYGLNRQQLILLLNPEFEKVPQRWRENLLGSVVHETINQIWNVPGADVAANVPAQVKIELRSALLKHIKEEVEHGHLKVSHPEMVLELPGAGQITKADLKGFVGAAH